MFQVTCEACERSAALEEPTRIPEGWRALTAQTDTSDGKGYQEETSEAFAHVCPGCTAVLMQSGDLLGWMEWVVLVALKRQVEESTARGELRWLRNRVAEIADLAAGRASHNAIRQRASEALFGRRDVDGDAPLPDQGGS